MLKALQVPHLSGATGRGVWFHFPDRKYNPGAFLVEMTAGLTVREGRPGGLLELNDAFLIPGRGHQCLYDREGHRVAESRVRRGEDEFIDSDDERIAPPSDCVGIAEPVLYLSSYFHHWGHFLTESISRLWAREAFPELRALRGCFAGGARPRAEDANNAAFFRDLAPPLDLLEARGPIRLAKCFVPAPSFVNRASAHRAHLAAPREVAQAHLAGAARAKSRRPVYLSRSRLTGGRLIRNEAALEDLLAKAGVAIVHPQAMSLREQIVLFDAHDVFIACVGSALHNTIFALAGADLTTHVLSQNWHNRNCLMIDAIVGNESHYVSALRRAPPDPGEPDIVFEIDLPLASEYFRAAGLV